VCGGAARKRSDRKFDFVDPHLICQSAVTPVVPTVAWTGNFEWRRLAGESADDFESRAHAECRAADPRPVQILIFSDKEISQ
jgi:hypothetical protein